MMGTASTHIIPPATAPARAVALAALDPRRWGCAPRAGGWSVPLGGLGEVHIARLDWRHAQLPSYRLDERGKRHAIDGLALTAWLQGEVWGMPPADWAPANLLAVLTATGGSVLAAYRGEVGWNGDGWLGFAIAAGGRSGVLVSHMLGVREGLRGGHDLGWLLKAIQAYEAVASGHHAASWTFDPMRGANARLNMEKLGATAVTLTVDKYGSLHSTLYGDVPTDRLTADWDLLSPAVAERLRAVHAGAYPGPDLAAVLTLPDVTPENLAAVSDEPALRYRIPADIDTLAHDDPVGAAAWRREMRTVFGILLNREFAVTAAPKAAIDTIARTDPGHFTITGFATSRGSDGNRENWYVLTRRTTGNEGAKT
ncbi:MAG: hypothetical protein IT337_08220 [Thermomicrobiales bacterium]|nr:hypothetical protein [Thermomicrobiales bacterium]